MAGSQKSFETRLGRFENAIALLPGWSDYDPTHNDDIKQTSLDTLDADIIAKNAEVETNAQTEQDDRDERTDKAFIIYPEDGGEEEGPLNPACMENRIVGILSYVTAEFDKDSNDAKTIAAILKTIKPKYPKKDPAQPRGAGKSPSERTFTALVGQASKVIAIITGLGSSYNPPDTDLSVTEMNTLNDRLGTLNKNITTKSKTTSDSRKDRSALYDGKQGMSKRITAILSYLASFPGHKKSQHYIDFLAAIKGL